MYRILLIDDEDRKRERLEPSIEDIKERYGDDSVSLTHAMDSDSGLRAVKAGKFDLIMLDYLLGKLDGTSLILQIRASDSDARIWMYTSSMNRKDAIESGADDLMDTLDTDCYGKFMDFVESQVKG